HGGYSGVLKNALDLMGFNEFQGKMIGLLGVAGGSMGAANSLNSLQTVGRTLRAWVVPFQVSIASAFEEFDKEGNLKNRVLEQRVKQLGEKVTRFAYLHKIGKSEEFLNAWQVAPVNPGGERKVKKGNRI
ncbi:NAD(P)H-dependent oxidoreductase, partial [Candidatus Marinimicrobia bacterium MT.SAG.3]